MPPPLPVLPKEIIEAGNQKRLVLFLGAGLSCHVGLPSWEKLKTELIKEARPRNPSPEDIRKQWKQMRFYPCFQSIKDQDETVYREMLKKALATSQAKLGVYSRLLNALLSLKPVSTVSSNVDDLLFDSKIYKKSDFRYKYKCFPQEIGYGRAFLIHGEGEDGIFTLFDQKPLYHAPDFINFMNNLFGTYCVLFVGYSFREDDLLNFARLPEGFKDNCENPIRHYALLPKHDSGRPQIELEEQYGISPLYYPGEDGNYENFSKTIFSWEIIREGTEEEMSKSAL